MQLRKYWTKFRVIGTFDIEFQLFQTKIKRKDLAHYVCIRRTTPAIRLL